MSGSAQPSKSDSDCDSSIVSGSTFRICCRIRRAAADHVAFFDLPALELAAAGRRIGAFPLSGAGSFVSGESGVATL
jgi:hypothetical protein